MPEYLRQNGYICPKSGLQGPFQWALGTHLSYFDHIHADSERAADFNTCMSGNRARRQHLLEWFPFESELLSGASNCPPDALMIDVGGEKENRA